VKYSTDFRRGAGYLLDKPTIVALWTIAKDFVDKPPDITVGLDGDHRVEMDN
jgi:hypothetical protein